MSAMLMPTEQQEPQSVYQILQQAINHQQEQTKIMQVMLNQMVQIEKNVKQIETNVEMKFSVMSDMVQKVKDSVTLTDAECYQLQSKVHTLSNQLTREYFADDEVSREEFANQVGKFRRGIWKLIKERFQVAKYSHIRRVDFQDVLAFVDSISMRNFVEV